MYCRDCQYDLSGQTTPRCPECATAFDPADPRTFLSKPFGPIRRFLDKKRGTLAVLLSLGYVAYLLIPPILLPRLRGCGGISLALVSQGNLKDIVTRWKLAIHSEQIPPATPHAIGAPSFERRLSPYQHENAIRNKRAWEDWLRQDLLWQALPVLILFTCLAVLLRTKMRRFCAFIAGVTACVVFTCLLAGSLLSLVYSGDRSYLKDYAYVPIQAWTSGPAGREPIVAYERAPLLEEQRIVAFEAGWVLRLREDEFRSVAAAQGIDIAGLSDSE